MADLSMMAAAALLSLMPEIQPPVLYAFGGGIAAAEIARVPAIRRHLAKKSWGLAAAGCLAATAWCFPTAANVPAVLSLAAGFTVIACGNSLFGVLEWPASVVLSEMGSSL